MKLTITIELSSLDQLRALEAAIEMFIDIETDRGKGATATEFSQEDRMRLAGAMRVQTALAGGRS